MDLLHNAFTAGELSPEMDGRFDLAAYYQGCRELENFVVRPAGGAWRRPGLEYIGEVADSDDTTRLVGFVTATTSYILEFGDYVMRVYKDGEIVNDGDDPYELETPYAADDVFDLVFAPRGQAIFHPSYEPRRLTCDGDTSWTLTAASFQYGPFLDENETEALTITPSGTTGNITLTAASSLFDSDHVGALFKMRHFVSEAEVAGRFNSTGTSDELTVKGDWTLIITQRWAGTIILQRSYDGGSTWKDLKRYTRTTPTAHTTKDKGTETEDGALYRLNMTWLDDDPGGIFGDLYQALFDLCQYSLTVKNTWQTGIVRVTGYTSATVVSATVLNTLGGSTATYRWSEGAWSAHRGYPACGTIHQSRIFAANTTHQPTGIWAGKSFKRIGDDRAMYPSTDDDDALSREIDLEDCHAIKWLASLWVLLAGSDGNLMKVMGPSEYQPITPTDLNVMAQSGVGASSVQPVRIAGNIVYLGRDSKHVFEMTYSDDTKVYNPEDLTQFAEHIAGTGVVDWAFQQQPYPILWAVTSDGNLIGLTRNKQEELLAWHPHSTDGSFESVAVIPQSSYDEVWVIVNRTVSGSTVRCVERMKPFALESSQRDHVFVDSSYTWDGGAAVTVTGVSVSATNDRVTVTAAAHGFSDGYTVKFASVAGCTDLNEKVYTVADAATNSFTLKTRDGSAYIDGSEFGEYTSGGTVERVTNSVTGLTHLAGESVAVLLDGQPTTGIVSLGGVYTVGLYKDRYYHNTITVGRPYTSKLSPMRPEVRTSSGSLQGRKKKITYCGLRLYQSYGGWIGTDADDLTEIDYSKRGDAANADVALVTDDLYEPHAGGWQDKGDIYIETATPLPFNVTAIMFGLEV